MKTLTKVSALGVVVFGLAGCADDNEKNAMANPITGEATAKGSPPPGAPKNAADYLKSDKFPVMITPKAPGADSGKSSPR
ncbi:MAG: hypothetical protein JWN86_1923 [Planctomycetota bacterium]|nr:hypothetical protein [Planctomycetota bacterium]